MAISILFNSYMGTEPKAACTWQWKALRRTDTFKRLRSCMRTAMKVASRMRFVVIGGHVRCVKYLFEANSEGIPRAEFVNSAAIRGYFECIKFFHSNKHFLFSANAMHYAAIGNHLAIVKFLHEHRIEGCKVETLFKCDKRGLPQVVEFLCSHRPMASAAPVVARAKQEDRFLLATKHERGARTVKATYAYK